VLAIDLPDADADVQISAGSSARFFVVADLSPTGSSSEPNRLRIRHLSSRSQIVNAGTGIAVSQAPGSGTEPRVITIPEPALVIQLGAGVALLAALSRRRRSEARVRRG
jgi:hypothetical protein